MGHTMWETSRPAFNKHRLWVVGFFFFSERLWNGSWLLAHWGKRPTLFSEDPSWTWSEKWQVCSERLIRANACLLYTVLRSKYKQLLGESTENDSPFQHHNPGSMVRVAKCLTAQFRCILPSVSRTWWQQIFIILYRPDKHTNKRNLKRISKYYLAKSFKHKIYLGTATHYIFKELNLNTGTQVSTLTKAY